MLTINPANCNQQVLEMLEAGALQLREMNKVSPIYISRGMAELLLGEHDWDKLPHAFWHGEQEFIIAFPLMVAMDPEAAMVQMKTGQRL